MSNGFSARHGAPPHRSPSPRSTRRRARCSCATALAVTSALAWRLPTWAGFRRRGRVTGRSSSGVTAHPITRRRSRAEVVFLLGEAATREEARGLIARYRTADLDGALRAVAERWDDVLGTVQVT